jgi:hypothetical protein
MVDPLVQRLLEQAIDSPVKLHLLLLFHENPRLEANARAIAERVCRDIWSVSQALQELAEDRVLLSIPGPGDHVYRYAPAEDLLEPIGRLLRGYDDPMERDKLQRSIRDLARYAPYRRATAWQIQVA